MSKRRRFALLGLVLYVAASPVFAAQGDRGRDWPRANYGEVPRGPERRTDPQALPEAEFRQGNRMNNMPHVERNHWYGHDAPADPSYRLDTPFAHGRFTEVGPSRRHGVVELDRGMHRFRFGGGFFFEVALWDWPICDGWCWDCGDDFAIYDDPDHIGWYLLYNVHTGVYVHVRYLGR